MTNEVKVCIIEHERCIAKTATAGKGNKMRINITMNDKLVKEIDKAAKEMYVSRSSFLALAAAKMIKEDKMVEIMPELIDAVRMIVEHDRNNNDGSEGEEN